MLLVVFWVCVSLALVSGQAAVAGDEQENNIKAILNLLSNGGSPDFGINQEMPMSDDIVNPPDDSATDFGAAYDLPMDSSKMDNPIDNMMKRMAIVYQRRCELYGSCMANKGRRRYMKCECPGGSSCKQYESDYICY